MFEVKISLVLVGLIIGQLTEGLILEYVDALMVGSQIVDLLPEDAGPKVLANKLHQVQLVLELGIFASQLLNEAEAGVVT